MGDIYNSELKFRQLITEVMKLTARPKWEYETILSPTDEGLKLFGAMGWELVCFCGKTAFFKRRIIEALERADG